jgi:hypothetical protein
LIDEGAMDEHNIVSRPLGQFGRLGGRGNGRSGHEDGGGREEKISHR